MFQGEDLLLYGLAGRITGVYRCQIGLQGQIAIVGRIDIVDIVVCPPVHIQCQCFLSFGIGIQRDAVVLGQLVKAGQAQGILALQEHFDTIDDGLVVGGIVQQAAQRQVLIVRDHEVDAAAAADQIIIVVVDDDVVAGTAEDGVFARAAVQIVVTAHTEQNIVTDTAEELIIAVGILAFHGLDEGIQRISFDQFFDALDRDIIQVFRLVIAHQQVIARTAVKGIVAATAIDDVVTFLAVDDVGGTAAGDGVIATTATGKAVQTDICGLRAVHI